METIIPSKEMKKYKIIEGFFIMQEFVLVEQLAIISQSSVRSVHSYIHDIREEVQEVGGSLESTNKGILLTLPSNIGLDYYKRELFKTSLGFQILELLFFNNGISIEFILKSLSISKSTFERTLRKLKSALKEYGLSICIDRNIKICGSELVIRQFFHRYFIEVYSPLEWPFSVDRMDLSLNAFNKFSKAVDRDINEINTYDNLIKLAVDLERHRNGNVLSRDEIYSFYRYIGVSVENIQMGFHIIDQNFLDESVRDYAEVFFSWKELLGINNLENFSNMESSAVTVIEEIESFLNKSCKMLNIKKINNRNKYIEVLEYLYISAFYVNGANLKSFILFKDEDYLSVEYLRDTYNNFYNEASNHFERICKIVGLKNSKNNFTTYMHILFKNFKSIKLALGNSKKTKKIVLIYDPKGIFGENEQIYRICPKLNAEECTTILFKEYELNEKTLEEYEYDCIVSTETINLKINKQIYVIGLGPDNRVITPVVRSIMCAE